MYLLFQVKTLYIKFCLDGPILLSHVLQDVFFLIYEGTEA